MRDAVYNGRGKDRKPAKLIELWSNRAFLAVISEMAEELERVLRYPRIKNKYNLHNEEIEQVVGTIKKFAVVVPDVIKLNVIKDDPDDDKVLACALAVKADYIVSGDSHLLELGAKSAKSRDTALNTWKKLSYSNCPP